MADCRHFEKTVKSPYICNRLTDFDEIWHDDAHSSLTADRLLKFRIFENPRPGKYTTRVDPHHVDNSHQVWSWYYHPRPSYSIFVCSYVTWPWPLTFWPWTVEYMAGHVTNLATKLEHPMPIRSWFMSYNVSVWLPLRMRTRPLRMRRITWPVSKESKTITYLESLTQIWLYIHYISFIGLRRQLRVAYSRASPKLKPLTA